MISRIWRGWTTMEDADEYENLLREKIFPTIADRQVRGYKSIQLFRKNHGDEVEFITIMWFDSWESVKEFAGQNFKRSYVSAVERKILKRYDNRSQHYEVREQFQYSRAI
ncbi:antibiotic biosynthesis monooxygenase [Fodinibius sediminis]|uniref:Antibiotic biosynthesis monooxygenase n=1 Tax=Fodinibius sediminis TaxID=1214077 RepID=A0A521DLG6_9BACT|nr:antibiotic biosynthesis monooxygenase [Fodinibius sediminis]SMO72547.1 hypothetical protein SAMN06265218_11119 [Fodinibius sediminis]